MAGASDGWRMLHPMALVTGVAKGVTSVFWPLVILLFAHGAAERRGWNPGVWMVAAPVAAVAALSLLPPVLAWLSTRYRLTSDALEFRSGFLFRKSRAMGYDRIHAVEGVVPVWLRPFHAVRLRVSAGGEEADIRLAAVPEAFQSELEARRAAARPDVAEETPEPSLASDGAMAVPMTDGVMDVPTSDGAAVVPASDGIADAPAPQPKLPSPDTPPVFRATTRDLLLFALTDVSMLAAAAVLWGVAQRIRELMPQRWSDEAGRAFDGFMAQGVLSMLLLAVACFALLGAASVVASLARFHDFTVWRRGGDLIVERGLFTRRTVTLPVSRIQSVIIRQSLPRRMLGLCSVEVGLSVSAVLDADSEGAQGMSKLLPVIGADRVYGTLHAMLPEWDPREPDVERTGIDLTRRFLTTPLASGGAATIALLLLHLWRDEAPWALAACAAAGTLLWTLARLLRAREEGYRLLPGKGIAVTGARGWTRFTVFTTRPRVQSFARTVALWHARQGLARVEMPLFVTAGETSLRFLLLPRAHADRLERWLEA